MKVVGSKYLGRGPEVVASDFHQLVHLGQQLLCWQAGYHVLQ